ncbi:MAG: selenocysteine-specific translation elongation factor, partial [Terracoccus sp.]
MHVVATAGHVDHGKSTLVRALTGSDPDRLAEERRRGLTIELGYAWTTLVGVGEVAFVDVPGHERFIATALAGVGPVPVVMFVVAADDPWMPQAAEHLAALDALGVERGLLVVTRADLADPGPALARARHELSGTRLKGLSEVVVSGRTGMGLDRLRRVLAEVLADIALPDPREDVRLWVDRRFHVKGSGTVVTGTLSAGTVRVGDQLAFGDERVRVRGLEALGTPREAVSGVARVALDLGGHAPAALSRGDVLVTPGAFSATTVVDVALSGEEDPPERPILHLGSALVAVHARRLGDGLHRLTLDRPLPLRIGDRAILRDPGRRALWGVRVLDPLPPSLSRRGAAVTRADVLATSDGTVATELAHRGVVRRSVLVRAGVRVEPLPTGTVEAGDWLVAPDRTSALRARLVEVVKASDTPLSRGVSFAAAAHALGLPDAAIVPALAAAPLRTGGGMVTLAAERALPPALVSALEGLASDLAAAPFAAPTAGRLAELGLNARTVAGLHHSGHVLRVAEGVVLLPGADDAAVEVLAGLDQPFTTSEARQALGTSRRVVLPLLGHLDATGRT